ncbi:hypothetical protein BH23THE1_BH23THE1_24680 [soil metagenome]
MSSGNFDIHFDSTLNTPIANSISMNINKIRGSSASMYGMWNPTSISLVFNKYKNAVTSKKPKLSDVNKNFLLFVFL